MHVTIPDFSLVLMVGPSGSGKTTFARKYFRPSEIVSSDHYRTVVGDDDRSKTTTADAFDLMEQVAATRLRRRRLTVIDATNLHRADRARFLTVARGHHAQVAAIVFDVGDRACYAHNAARPEPRPDGIVRRHLRALRRAVRDLPREGLRRRARFTSVDEADTATVTRERLTCDRRHVGGRFDVIGDVHACRSELETLFGRLGYEPAGEGAGRAWTPPEGVTAVFTGDLVDRGPDPVGVLTIAMNMEGAGRAIVVRGNHDDKLGRLLSGRRVKETGGLEETKKLIDAAPAGFAERARQFLGGLPSHVVLDGGRLVVTHAAMRADLVNRTSGEVREFAMYGETDGSKDAAGLPVRTYEWVRGYKPGPLIVYGHDPVAEPAWDNSTLCIDTGCAVGGRLSAVRYPESDDFVSVPAERAYAPRPKPLSNRASAAGRGDADPALLDVADFIGPAASGRPLSIPVSGLDRPVSIPHGSAAAAFDVLTRDAVDPRWLIYVPPTMSPCEAAPDGDLLERPAEAFDYYRSRGVTRVLCEEKHMGSRAVIVVTRGVGAAAARFGFRETNPRAGRVYTRTGRPFFDDPAAEAAVLDVFRTAMDADGFWDRHRTAWACFDAEVMPWSAKGQGLIRRQYAPAATAAHLGLGAAVEALTKAAGRDAAHRGLLADYAARKEMAAAYAAAYERYNWVVETVSDLRIAPFHLMATEEAVHAGAKSHRWHVNEIDRLADAADGPVMVKTARREIDFGAADAGDGIERATRWWTALTAGGGEGMVVKPLDFSTDGMRNGRAEPVTPAVKCRGREYLRIIYGPEYTTPHNLARLRKRSVRGKSWRALREYALGLDGLRHFVDRRPLTESYRCALGVLALESEAADPRL